MWRVIDTHTHTERERERESELNLNEIFLVGLYFSSTPPRAV